MKKLYKKEKNGALHYAEYWLYQNEIILHTGEVGNKGEVEKIKGYKNEKDFEREFDNKFYPLGYEILEANELCWIVVQYPIASKDFGDKIELLKDKVLGCLNNEIGWLGLGYVDGYDIGKQTHKKTDHVLNIFCIVVDKNIGVEAVRNILKNNKLKYNSLRIASRKNLDEDYILHYSFDKKENVFFL